jgi:hypothetical protein
MTNSYCNSTAVVGVMRCECISGTQYSIIYGACITPIAYNQSCLITADCASNFICTTVNGASYCLCGTNTRYYYSLNATCLDKVLFNQPCSSTGPYCDDIRLLQCSAYGNCTCPSGYYYSTITTRCEAQIYPGNSCTATSSCITNANCVSNICSCINGSYYYDITTGQCVSLKSYGIACSEQEQCKTGLHCISSICQCLTTQYYNATSSSCTTGATNGSACSSSSGLYCNTADGLYCSSSTSTCVCSTNYYWNGTECLQSKYLYNTCTATNQCPANGACTGNICKCTATTYYNSTLNSCVTYSTYGQTCVANVFVTSECSSTQNLVCSSTTSGLCQCSSSAYYNATGSTCSTKSNSGATCTSSSTCNDLLGLVCNSSACTCITGTYWSGSTCVETLGAGQPCGANADCTSPLTCPAGRCQCQAPYYLDIVTVRCLLTKATGFPCTYGFECTNGVCTNSLCN